MKNLVTWMGTRIGKNSQQLITITYIHYKYYLQPMPGIFINNIAKNMASTLEFEKVRVLVFMPQASG